MGTDRVFDSDADIIDFQTAIVEYDNGASLTFHTNLNVPDDYRHFCVVGAKGMAGGRFRSRIPEGPSRHRQRKAHLEFLSGTLRQIAALRRRRADGR